jgi:hypothetical protein
MHLDERHSEQRAERPCERHAKPLLQEDAEEPNRSEAEDTDDFGATGDPPHESLQEMEQLGDALVGAFQSRPHLEAAFRAEASEPRRERKVVVEAVEVRIDGKERTREEENEQNDSGCTDESVDERSIRRRRDHRPTWR